MTAGIYVFPEKVRRLGVPHELGRLRDFLAWLAKSGEPIEALEIGKVVDVDRAEDLAVAEELAAAPMSGVPAPRCWGIYRELAHSPGRETDDAEILRATGEELAARGFDVALKSTDELPDAGEFESVPPFLFVMCERVPVVEKLAAWERRGARIVNRPAGIRNTDRERTIALFGRHGVPHPRSVLVETGKGDAVVSRARAGSSAATSTRPKPGDVAFAGDPRRARRAPRAPRRPRHPPRGRAGPRPRRPDQVLRRRRARRCTPGRPSWFQWFYHRDQTLANHPFDAAALEAATARAAAALSLEVYGGDAIVSADGAHLTSST